MFSKFQYNKSFIRFFIVIGVIVFALIFSRSVSFSTNEVVMDDSDVPLYYMTAFQSVQMDEKGEPFHWLLADRMANYIGNVTRFNKPTVRIKQSLNDVWEITADQGVMEQEHIIQLIQNVRIYREGDNAEDEVHILTTDFRLNLDTNIGKTATDVVVINRNSVVNARGMEIYIDTHALQLLSNVRGWYIEGDK